MPKKISIVNHKGGCAKTTCCTSIAHGLSRAGKRVLIIDVDPQGNASQSFGIAHPTSLYHVLTDSAAITDCIVTARDNLDILPANKTLTVAEQSIVGEMGRERVLARHINMLNNGYDYFLFDCAPSWRLLNQNALLASDTVIIPVNMEFFALVGVKDILTDLEMIGEKLGHKLDIALVVPTFYDMRNKKSKQILEQLVDFFGADKVTAPIRTNVRISEAPYYKKTIFEYAPRSHGAQDFEQLTKRVLAL